MTIVFTSQVIEEFISVSVKMVFMSTMSICYTFCYSMFHGKLVG